MNTDDLNKIERLHSLMASGHLTKEEFQSEKAHILGIESNETEGYEADREPLEQNGDAVLNRFPRGSSSSRFMEKGARIKIVIGVLIVAATVAGGGTFYWHQLTQARSATACSPASNADCQSVENTVVVNTIKAGQGASPTPDDYVLVNYVGYLSSGEEFDRGKRVPIPVKGVIPGFGQSLRKMQRGGKYHILIPADLAYGAQEQRNAATGKIAIPANSDLSFDVELIDFKNATQVEQKRKAQQQAQAKIPQSTTN